MYSTISVMLAIVASAAAKTVIINAGQNGALSFSPDSTTADVGDTLEFHFFGSIHTAVQGDFSTPCQMSSGGFDSGPIQNGQSGSGSVFQVTVKDTNPIWFFCVTPGHCQSGMAGVINPPSSGDSLATYKSNAAGTTSQSGGTVEGGVVVPVPSGGGSSSSTPPPSSSTSAPPSSSESKSVTGTTTTSSAPGTVTSTTSSVAGSTSTSASSTPSSSKSSSKSESEASSSASKSTSSEHATSSTTAAAGSTSASKSSEPSGSATSSALSSPTTVVASGGVIAIGRVEIYTLMGVVMAGLGFLGVAM